MSDLWGYEPKKCDGDYCPYDCDKCGKADEYDEDDGDGAETGVEGNWLSVATGDL